VNQILPQLTATVLQLFSMTKLVTGIACLQLIEHGQLSLDDVDLITTKLPELASQPILLPGLETTPRTRPLTLRHLLTHTSGLAYAFSSPLIEEWAARVSPRASVDALVQPLVFEPGSHYKYSIGIDWAGVLVERVSGLSLEEYFHKNIFGPCGLTTDDITFLPTPGVKARLASMYGRDDDGKVVPSDGLRAVQDWTPEDVTLRLGGAGLLGTADAYLTFLSHLLACRDVDGILTRASFATLFTSALPSRDSEFGAQIYKDVGEIVSNEGLTAPQFTSGEALGHSVGLMLLEAPNPAGRHAGSGFWSGAARTRFWIDPEAGIAAFCGTQMVELDWGAFAQIVSEFEDIVYKELQ
jgi:CubicO group peptidase (beta-lactamase class C family)